MGVPAGWDAEERERKVVSAAGAVVSTLHVYGERQRATSKMIGTTQRTTAGGAARRMH
jgi:hypothetical protein